MHNGASASCEVLDLGDQKSTSNSDVLRLEIGGEHLILSSRTKTVISRLIYKISRHMTNVRHNNTFWGVSEWDKVWKL